ncbi:MAG: maleylpyruvate isomerase family mycothiol-dependent enzyme [Euzebyales bacterium]|nr:maleylpyruvate isomerase family mycothiol-dependent enzyme [Euzebyales bacterium]
MTDLGSAIDVGHLFAPERQALLELLGGLNKHEWGQDTPCPGWSVHDLAVHLVHDDLRRLSGQRDRHPGAWLAATSLDELAEALDEANRHWVTAVAPTLSPRLTCDMLAWLAGPSETHLVGLDPAAEGATVSWAGPGPHPNWLDVAREFTERWVHHQQVRQAVGRPGLAEREHLEPVVDTFTRALPSSLPRRPDGTEVQLRVVSPFERSWTLRASGPGWTFVARSTQPAAVVSLPASALWRRAVRMLSHREARGVAGVDGDLELVEAMLDIRAAIVPSDAPS